MAVASVTSSERGPGTWRLLVVDEDPLSRRTQVHILAQYGYICAGAESAEAARRAVRTFQPDIVVLDWVFRDASGVGLAARLRSDSAKPLRIIALSVWDEPYDFAKREGIDVYFVKPTSLAEIDRWIRGSVGADAAIVG